MQITLCDGKYTIIQEDNPFVFKALRYSDEWRDLTGDKLVLALVQKIEEQQEEILTLKHCVGFDEK